jgi:hypothetical protein
VHNHPACYKQPNGPGLWALWANFALTEFSEVRIAPVVDRGRTRLARIAGLLYLIVGIFGGFADAYVPAKVYAPGDAATTAVLEDAPLLAMLLH